MKRVSSSFDYHIYDSIDELEAEDRRLLLEARNATSTAYAPYSNFFVGAAVLLENDKVIWGSNQENAAFPSGICAEQVAVFTAGSNYPGIKIKSIAVTAVSESDFLMISPCGTCRQVIAEYELRQSHIIRIILSAGNGRVIVIPDSRSLLPVMFGPEHLKST